MPQARDWHGRFVSAKSESSPPPPSLVQVTTYKKPKLTTPDPPLVDLKITNPVTYLRLWWKKIMSGEGVSIRIHPITALLIALAVTGGSFFLGRYLQLRSDLVDRYLPQLSGLNSIEAAFTGTLYTSEGNFYLTQSESQSIRLKSENIKLTPYDRRSVFVSGRFDPLTRSLTVSTVTVQ